MALNLPSLDAAIRQPRPNAKPAKRAPKSRQRIRRQSKPKAERDRITEVRNYVIGRERGRCRCCRFRRGESMHELRSRGAGGKVSKTNSVWVCGQLGNGPECHGQLQRAEIRVLVSQRGADGTITFWPQHQKNADWLRIKLSDCIESGPMSTYEDP